MSARRKTVAAWLLAAGASVPAAAAEPRTIPGHDRSFWRGIVQNHFEVPAGQSADVLVLELGDYLGSSDPELRDDLAAEPPRAEILKTLEKLGS